MEEALRTAYTGLVKADPNLQGPESGLDEVTDGDTEDDGQAPSTDGSGEGAKESSPSILPFVIAGAVILVLGAAGVGLGLAKKKACKKS
jgi:hypothetical protein